MGLTTVLCKETGVGENGEHQRILGMLSASLCERQRMRYAHDFIAWGRFVD